jgi:hypothetical protein
VAQAIVIHPKIRGISVINRVNFLPRLSDMYPDRRQPIGVESDAKEAERNKKTS